MTRPQVLFVDDEPRVLDGLRRSMRGKRHDWQMDFAAGGDEALDLLARTEHDVVVSDMRMPGMDGAALLTAVSAGHPGVARVVLSGHIEPAAVVQVAMAGHRFLTKPADPGSLTGVIEQLLIRTSGGHPGAARRLAGTIRSLPALPGHADAIDLLLTSGADLDCALQAASGDIGLAAKLLQLSNSRFFGERPRNYSIESIVRAMGVPMIQSVAGAARRVRMPPAWLPGSDPVLEAVGNHARATARLVESLASPANRPHAHAAALLQDIGHLVCLAATGDPGPAVDVAAATRDGVPFRDVGVELLHLWGVPPPIVSAVAQRDTPHRPEASGLGVAGALRVAHLLIAQAATGCVPGGAERELDTFLSHPQLRMREVDWRTAARDCLHQVPARPCGVGA